MNDKAMKEALKRRKGMGVDITLIIGGKPEEDEKNSGLAPEVKDTEGEVAGGPEADPMDEQIQKAMMAGSEGKEDENSLAGKIAMAAKKLKK